MDPLKTRSIPGHLWEKVPQTIKELDENIRISFIETLSLEDSKVFIWLIESPVSITFFLALALLIWISSKKKETLCSINNFKFLVFLIGSLGISDLISSQLKFYIGRLKPHVSYYNFNPDFVPALSLPSNHAFNTSCLLCFLTLSSKTKSDYRFVGALFVVTLIIGLSRISLGQHYPLDVLSGWIFGSLFGLVCYKIKNWLNI